MGSAVPGRYPPELTCLGRVTHPVVSESLKSDSEWQLSAQKYLIGSCGCQFSPQLAAGEDGSQGFGSFPTDQGLLDLRCRGQCSNSIVSFCLEIVSFVGRAQLTGNIVLERQFQARPPELGFRSGDDHLFAPHVASSICSLANADVQTRMR
jgi:hypothetical protein